MSTVLVKFFKITVYGFFIGSFFLPVHAALLNIENHGDYLTDTTTGMSWYKASLTAGMSYDYVESQFGAGGEFDGWRFATAEEFGAMLDSFTGIATGINGIEQTVVVSGGDPLVPQVWSVIQLFGHTYQSGGSGGTTFLHGYLADQNAAGEPYLGQLSYTSGWYGFKSISTDFGDSWDRLPGINGSWLVKEMTVPAPSIVFLLFAGLVAISIFRRRGN